VFTLRNRLFALAAALTFGALLAPRPAAASIPRDTFRPSLDAGQITQPYFTQNAGVAPLTESAQAPEYVLVVVECQGSLYGIVCRNDPVNNTDALGLAPGEGGGNPITMGPGFDFYPRSGWVGGQLDFEQRTVSGLELSSRALYMVTAQPTVEGLIWVGEHPRVAGTIRATGGAIEVGVGGVYIYGTGGGGALLGGGLLVGNGADNFQAGLRSIISGENKQALVEYGINKGVEAAGGPQWVGTILYCGTQVGTPILATRLTQLGRTTTVLDDLVRQSGVSLDDAAFVRFDPVEANASIEQLGLQTRFFEDQKIWITRYQSVKGTGDAADLETMLYRQNLWPRMVGKKFPNGATLRVIENVDDAAAAGLSNMRNGVPQWRLVRDIPPRDARVIVVLPRQR